MPTDRKKKAAARALAARTGWSYTAALRRLDAPDRPFDMMTVGGGPCPPGCAEAKHPGVACWLWRPQDAKTSSWEVRQWAALPSGRALQVAEYAHEVLHRANPRHYTRAVSPRGHWWLLALIYCMLTEEHPELAPNLGELRAAVEADDLVAVHAVMDPLDRAAAGVATKDADQWWTSLKPRLDAYVAVVAADDSIPYTWIEIEQGHEQWTLVERWHRAWKTYRDSDGYPAVHGVLWSGVKTDLDLALTSRHGGHAPGAQVHLDDGGPARVYAAEWEQAGPPTGYWVRDLVPNPYFPGQLKTAMGSGRLLPAAACRPTEG